jgi:predicted cytidylate kinase
MAVIRVSGYQGSGKTTVCKRLAEALSYKYIYMGQIFRDMALAEGKIIDQFYAELDSDPAREKKVDADAAALCATQDNQIIEGRMAPFWDTPFEKVNLLFTIDAAVGAKRQQERPEYRDKTVTEVLTLSEQRLANERLRYRKLYGIDDFLWMQHFDEIIDTTHMDRDQVFAEAMARLELHGILPKGCSRR